MPINLSSFLSEFFENAEDTFLPELTKVNELHCDQCGMTYDEFTHTGKFGCANCYDIFSNKIDPILKNIHASNRHVGRKGKIATTKLNKEELQKEKTQHTTSNIEQLKEKLKQAIKEERYEDAAKIRDEIKKLEL